MDPSQRSSEARSTVPVFRWAWQLEAGRHTRGAKSRLCVLLSGALWVAQTWIWPFQLLAPLEVVYFEDIR